MYYLEMLETKLHNLEGFISITDLRRVCHKIPRRDDVIRKEMEILGWRWDKYAGGFSKGNDMYLLMLDQHRNFVRASHEVIRELYTLQMCKTTLSTPND